MSSHSHTVGVIHKLNSYFIISVLSGIEQVVAESDHNIIIAHSAERKFFEAANAHNLFHKRTDGMIASLACHTEDLSHYEVFIQKRFPWFFLIAEEGGTGLK